MKSRIFSFTILLFTLTFSTIYSQSAWQIQPSGTSNDLWGVKFINQLTGTCVGENGTIRTTTNGGTTWFAQASGTTDTLFCINFPKPSYDTGYICGTSGTLRKTTNGGVNWFSLPSGTTNTLKSIFFVNANTGYTVGYLGQIRKTTDGGINWTQQSSGTTQNLWSVHFVNNNTGWAIGFNGTIRKTTNGGANWFSQGSGFGSFELVFVSFLNSNTGIITTGQPPSTDFLMTTNGGTTWNPINLATTHSQRCIDFIDNNNWMMVGDAGDFLKTTNAGQNWSFIPSGVPNWLFSTSFVSTTEGWTVGRDGIILHTTTGGVLPPNAPNNLIAFPISTTAIYLAWFDNSNNEQGFKIERSLTTPDNFQEVGQTGPNTLNFIDNNGVTAPNTYYYRVYAFNAGANSGYSDTAVVMITGIEPTGNDIPDSYSLYNNYPNPFNPSTKIKFDIPKNDFVSLRIYDLSGKEVGIVVSQGLTAGRYEIEFNANYLTSGTYFYRIETTAFTETRKMVLVK